MSKADARARLDGYLAGVAARDGAALRQVYDATSAKLFGICLRIAGEREAAEDALQETYLKVWQRAGRFDPSRASAITWLILIARGTAIDARRAAIRRDAGHEAAAVDTAIDAGAGDADEGQAIDECMKHLDGDQRDPIRSAFFDGYSYAELASRFSVPLGTMKSRIRRGLTALKRCLDDV